MFIFKGKLQHSIQNFKEDIEIKLFVPKVQLNLKHFEK